MESNNSRKGSKNEKKEKEEDDEEDQFGKEKDPQLKEIRDKILKKHSSMKQNCIIVCTIVAFVIISLFQFYFEHTSLNKLKEIE